MARRSRRSINPRESFRLPRNSDFGPNETVGPEQLRILNDISVAARRSRFSNRDDDGTLLPDNSNFSFTQLQQIARDNPEWYKKLEKTLQASFSPPVPNRTRGLVEDWLPEEPSLSFEGSSTSDGARRRQLFKRKRLYSGSQEFGDALVADVPEENQTANSAEQEPIPRRSRRSSRKLGLRIDDLTGSEITESPREAFGRWKKVRTEYSGKFSQVFDELRASSGAANIEGERETVTSSQETAKSLHEASTLKLLPSPEQRSLEVSPSPNKKQPKSWKKTRSSRHIDIEVADSPREESPVQSSRASPTKASAPEEETSPQMSPSPKQRQRDFSSRSWKRSRSTRPFQIDVGNSSSRESPEATIGKSPSKATDEQASPQLSLSPEQRQTRSWAKSRSVGPFQIENLDSPSQRLQKAPVEQSSRRVSALVQQVSPQVSPSLRRKESRSWRKSRSVRPFEIEDADPPNQELPVPEIPASVQPVAPWNSPRSKGKSQSRQEAETDGADSSNLDAVTSSAQAGEMSNDSSQMSPRFARSKPFALPRNQVRASSAFAHALLEDSESSSADEENFNSRAEQNIPKPFDTTSPSHGSAKKAPTLPKGKSSKKSFQDADSEPRGSPRKLRDSVPPSEDPSKRPADTSLPSRRSSNRHSEAASPSRTLSKTPTDATSPSRRSSKKLEVAAPRSPRSGRKSKSSQAETEHEGADSSKLDAATSSAQEGEMSNDSSQMSSRFSRSKPFAMPRNKVRASSAFARALLEEDSGSSSADEENFNRQAEQNEPSPSDTTSPPRRSTKKTPTLPKGKSSKKSFQDADLEPRRSSRKLRDSVPPSEDPSKRPADTSLPSRRSSNRHSEAASPSRTLSKTPTDATSPSRRSSKKVLEAAAPRSPRSGRKSKSSQAEPEHEGADSSKLDATTSSAQAGEMSNDSSQMSSRFSRSKPFAMPRNKVRASSAFARALLEEDSGSSSADEENFNRQAEQNEPSPSDTTSPPRRSTKKTPTLPKGKSSKKSFQDADLEPRRSSRKLRDSVPPSEDPSKRPADTSLPSRRSSNRHSEAASPSRTLSKTPTDATSPSRRSSKKVLEAAAPRSPRSGRKSKSSQAETEHEGADSSKLDAATPSAQLGKSANEVSNNSSQTSPRFSRSKPFALPRNKVRASSAFAHALLEDSESSSADEENFNSRAEQNIPKPFDTTSPSHGSAKKAPTLPKGKSSKKSFQDADLEPRQSSRKPRDTVPPSESPSKRPPDTSSPSRRSSKRHSEEASADRSSSRMPSVTSSPSHGSSKRLSVTASPGRGLSKMPSNVALPTRKSIPVGVKNDPVLVSCNIMDDQRSQNEDEDSLLPSPRVHRLWAVKKTKGVALFDDALVSDDNSTASISIPAPDRSLERKISYRETAQESPPLARESPQESPALATADPVSTSRSSSFDTATKSPTTRSKVFRSPASVAKLVKSSSAIRWSTFSESMSNPAPGKSLKRKISDRETAQQSPSAPVERASRIRSSSMKSPESSPPKTRSRVLQSPASRAKSSVPIKMLTSTPAQAKAEMEMSSNLSCIQGKAEPLSRSVSYKPSPPIHRNLSSSSSENDSREIRALPPVSAKSGTFASRAQSLNIESDHSSAKGIPLLQYATTRKTKSSSPTRTSPERRRSDKFEGAQHFPHEEISTETTSTRKCSSSNRTEPKMTRTTAERSPKRSYRSAATSPSKPPALKQSSSIGTRPASATFQGESSVPSPSPGHTPRKSSLSSEDDFMMHLALTRNKTQVSDEGKRPTRMSKSSPEANSSPSITSKQSAPERNYRIRSPSRLFEKAPDTPERSSREEALRSLSLSGKSLKRRPAEENRAAVETSSSSKVDSPSSPSSPESSLRSPPKRTESISTTTSASLHRRNIFADPIAKSTSLQSNVREPLSKTKRGSFFLPASNRETDQSSTPSGHSSELTSQKVDPTLTEKGNISSATLSLDASLGLAGDSARSENPSISDPGGNHQSDLPVTKRTSSSPVLGKKTSAFAKPTGTPLRQATLHKAFFTSRTSSPHPDPKDATQNISIRSRVSAKGTSDESPSENSAVSRLPSSTSTIRFPSQNSSSEDSDSGLYADDIPRSANTSPEGQLGNESGKPRFEGTSVRKGESEVAPHSLKREKPSPKSITSEQSLRKVVKTRSADIRHFLLKKSCPSEYENSELQNWRKTDSNVDKPSGSTNPNKFDAEAVLARMLQFSEEKQPIHSEETEGGRERSGNKPSQKTKQKLTNNNRQAQAPKKKFQLIMPDGEVYRCPKLAKPKKFITDKMYRFLMKKLEPRYELSSRVKAEEFVADLCDTYSKVLRRKNHKPLVVHIMKSMVRLGLVCTYSEFYRFIEDFMPMDFRRKAIPCYGSDLAPERTKGLHENLA